MSENLLVPIVRYLSEDLTEAEYNVAVKDGHVDFLAKAFALRPEDLHTAVKRVRAEKSLMKGVREGWNTGGIFKEKA